MQQSLCRRQNLRLTHKTTIPFHAHGRFTRTQVKGMVSGMQNLIRNSRLRPRSGGGARCFSSSDITYDNFCVDGCRTCSITQTGGMQGVFRYDPLIPVWDGCCLNWGCVLRAIEAEDVRLQADFYDAAGMFVDTLQADISGSIGDQFRRRTARFIAPLGAANVQLSICFAGTVTACTLFSPEACYL